MKMALKALKKEYYSSISAKSYKEKVTVGLYVNCFAD